MRSMEPRSAPGRGAALVRVLAGPPLQLAGTAPARAFQAPGGGHALADASLRARGPGSGDFVMRGPKVRRFNRPRRITRRVTVGSSPGQFSLRRKQNHLHIVQTKMGAPLCLSLTRKMPIPVGLRYCRTFAIGPQGKSRDIKPVERGEGGSTHRRRATPTVPTSGGRALEAATPSATGTTPRGTRWRVTVRAELSDCSGPGNEVVGPGRTPAPATGAASGVELGQDQGLAGPPGGPAVLAGGRGAVFFGSRCAEVSIWRCPFVVGALG